MTGATARIRRGLARPWHRRRDARRRERIGRILASPGGAWPRPIDSEEVFRELQQAGPGFDGYGWDAYSNWWRGVQHALCLVPLSGLKEPGAEVLEAACGDGMTGSVLASYGHGVTLHDLEDWRDDRTRGLSFVAGDLCAPLPLEPGRFDLIYSYNAFEHIHDPSAALAELARLLRPGGLIYLDFGPLYASPWGLHAFSALRMPYPQFLFSPEFLQRKFDELGLYDLGRRTSTLQPLNRWTPSRFDRLWRESGLEVCSATSRANTDHLDLVERFPEAFRGLGLTFDDLTIEQVDVLLRKPSAGPTGVRPCPG